MIVMRSLWRELYATLLTIVLILLILFITNQLVHYLNVAATGQISMMAVMEMMVLQVPLLLGYLLPMAMYLGILIVLGRWYADNEMTVLSSCGMSWAKLFGMVMLFAALLAIVVAVVMLWLEPLAQMYRTKVLEASISKLTIAKVVPNRFQVFGQAGVFYTKKLSRIDKSMQDVIFSRGLPGRKDQLPGRDMVIAKQAVEKDNWQGRGRFLIFKDGYRYMGAPGALDFQVVKYAQYAVKLTPQHAHLNDWPFNAPSSQLWHMRHTNRQAAAIIQWRMALPISVFLLALLAVPLSVVKSRQGKFAQMIPALLIYIGYADLMFLGRAWIRKGVVSPDLGLWWIHGIVLLLALLLIAWRVGFKRIFKRSAVAI